MGGIKRYPNLPSLHDLALFKDRVTRREFVFGGVPHQFRRYFPDLSIAECIARIRTLIARVEPDDYARQEPWRDQKTGKNVVADVYGLADEEHGGFFIKFSAQSDWYTLHSCHPLDSDLELKCGRTLRTPK